MTTKKEHDAAEARTAHRQELDEERKADEAAERREDAAAERKAGAARAASVAAPAPAPDAPVIKPVVAIAHFTAGEVEAIDAALRDSAKDAAVYVLQTAIKRAMPQ